MQSMNPKEKWDKLSVELPPGWHETMQKVSELCGDVPLKYLYGVAIDQFLTNGDLATIEEAAWAMHRHSKKDVSKISSLHKAGEIEKRLKGRRRS